MDWRERAVAAETALANAIDPFTSLLEMLGHPDNVQDAIEEARKALGEMVKPSEAKGEARAGSNRLRRRDAIFLAELAEELSRPVFSSGEDPGSFTLSWSSGDRARKLAHLALKIAKLVGSNEAKKRARAFFARVGGE